MTSIHERADMTSPQPIVAKQLLLPRDTATDAAARVAARVVDAFRSSETVTVDFQGLRGVASSYFNTLFRTVGEAIGCKRMQEGLSLRYESDAQRAIGDRSWTAVLAMLENPDPGHEVA